MKKDKIQQATEYNNWAEDFVTKNIYYDQQSRQNFHSCINFETEGKRLLDIGCGGGYDLEIYRDTMKCIISGIDTSEKEVVLANNRLGEEVVKCGYSNNIPHKDASFDIVVSKYAAQAFEDVEDFYREVQRVLKPGGYFVLLATHPMRHFMEKEKVKGPRKYFTKEFVTSWIYEHTIPLTEYSYNLNDYLSPNFLKHFNLEFFQEYSDSKETVEWVDDEEYPAYFIIKAVKK